MQDNFKKGNELKGRGVYAIVNTNNGKVYVGSSSNIKGRFNQHTCTLRGNKHRNADLQADYNSGDHFVMYKLASVPVKGYSDTQLENFDLREYEYMAMYLLESYKPEHGYNEVFVDVNIFDKVRSELELIQNANMIKEIQARETE